MTADYYAILGVAPTCEDVVIRAAYVALRRRFASGLVHQEKGNALANLPTRARWSPRKRDVAGGQRNEPYPATTSSIFLRRVFVRRLSLTPSFDFSFGEPAGADVAEAIELQPPFTAICLTI